MLSRTSSSPASAHILGLSFITILGLLIAPLFVFAEKAPTASKATQKDVPQTVDSTDAQTSSSTPVQPSISNTNIANARIEGQKDSSVSLSFDIINNDAFVQPDIRYGVQMLTTSVDPAVKGTVVDEQVYDERVVVAPNMTVHKNIAYTAPAYLSGVYRIHIYATTTSGYMLASQDVDLVRLTRSTTTETPFVRHMTCALSSGEINVAPGAPSAVKCTFERSIEEGRTIVPHVITHVGTTSGNLVSSITGSPLTPADSAEFSFTSPSNQGQYVSTISFVDTDGNQVAYPVTLAYVVGDSTISVQNVRFNSVSYAVGDTAHVFVAVQGLLQNTQAEGGSLMVALVNKKGEVCADAVSVPLTNLVSRTNPVWDASLTVKKECTSPVVSVSVKDSVGTVLATYSTEDTQDSPWMMILFIVGGIVIAGLLGFLFIRLRGKYPAIFPVLILALVASATVGYAVPVARAQSSSPTTLPTTISNIDQIKENAPVSVIANINISNATIVSNTNGKLRVAFDIDNQGDAPQSDIRYGLQLVHVVDKRQEMADTFVADETVTVSGKKTLHRELSYTIPPTLSGSYDVWVIAKTTGGLMLGLNNAGKVTLIASGDHVEILPDTCHVIVGTDTKKTYTLLQGVDVEKNEELHLVCTVQNSLKKSVTATPVLETYRRSVLGEKVTMEYPVPTDIVFAAGEKKEISITIPKAADPQAYDASVVLVKKEGGEPLSSKVVVHYVLRGGSATVQNITLDKGSYMRGDTISATVFFAPSADNFPDSRAGRGTAVPGLAVTLTIKDSKGRACIDPVTKNADNNFSVIFSVSAIADCDAPVASVSLADANGVVLDSRTVETTQTGTSPVSQSQAFSMNDALILLGFLVVVGLGFIGWNMLRHKVSNQ